MNSLQRITILRDKTRAEKKLIVLLACLQLINGGKICNVFTVANILNASEIEVMEVFRTITFDDIVAQFTPEIMTAISNTALNAINGDETALKALMSLFETKGANDAKARQIASSMQPRNVTKLEPIKVEFVKVDEG